MHHTMDMLWEKFQSILSLYMKPISLQSKASVVCSITIAVFIDFCLKKLNVFSQHIGKKNPNIWIPQNKSPGIEMLITFLCWLRYYLMMQYQPNMKSKWSTRVWSTLALSASISSLLLQLVQTQAARWKAAAQEQLTCAHLHLDISKSG